FFTTGGSTAVDTALRFVEFRNNVRGLKDKKGIIVQVDGYHGSTALTAACSGRFGGAANFDVDSPRIHFISSPNPRRFPGRTEAEVCDLLVNEFRDTVERAGPGTIAAFLTEPLLASGGMILPPEGYHRRIKAICEAHDIVYIADEVVTGFGRLGEWFALESVFGVTPDIVTFAKGLTSGYVPLGGLAISERLLDNISGDNAHGAYFNNGYTYSGHPVSCAAALANIAIFEDEALLEHVRDIAPYFEACLKTLSDLPVVVDVRTKGLLGCVECMVRPGSALDVGAPDRALGEKIDRYAFEKGLIVRPLGNMCVLSPPLVITRAQIDEMVAILRAAILQAAEELAEAA
ncbi:aminotransferase class III-fold pyridoxal phosphate-dependent enzyme, partial [Pseudooceanicola sp. CBS1P-1]